MSKTSSIEIWGLTWVMVMKCFNYVMW